MARLLYVKVNPKRDEDSSSAQLALHFLEEYTTSHPGDSIDRLDLYTADIPFLDTDIFSAWGKFASKAELSEVEQGKVRRMDALTEQFLRADKVVFSAPFWNLGFPPMLKAYIDTICIAGKTFEYTESGPRGLVPDKPALLIETRGGFYSEGPAAELEFSRRYLRTILAFLGIQNFQAVVAEGLDADPAHAAATREAARRTLSDLAASF